MLNIPLATEAAESGSSPSGMLAMIVLLVALAVFAIAYYVVGPGQRRRLRPKGDIPLAMRPYHSDEELETTGLERAMSWGVALSLFAAIFLPLYWLIEPARIEDKRDEFYMQDVNEGRRLFADNCSTCHGQNAEGGFASHPDPEVDAPWPAPALDNITARYEDSEIVTDIQDFITETIKRGREGTPMPAWGAAYQGPMNDQQIESIVTYLLSIQTGEVDQPDAEALAAMGGHELFQDNCARCHGQDAEGFVGPQLINEFERFGWEPGDETTLEEARAAVRDTILTGRNVPTAANMPPFENTLTDEAVTAIVDYLESIQETGGPQSAQLGGPPGDDDGEDDQ